ncbi:PKD domain-containing protein [Rossellomorea aquimaris]|nr:PKD domain-containing protein [Rossellomorea aquimaris]
MNRVVVKVLFLLSLIFVATMSMNGVGVNAANPHSPESSVSNALSSGSYSIGSKDFSWTGGKRMVYDVYSSKYLSNGWTVETRNFNGTSQPYLKFDGWAVLSGYKTHTASNHSTHIMLRKKSGDSGVGAQKLYLTTLRNISATEDLEYNNQGPGVWNECASGTTNKNNTTCNMRYDNVGFTAYIPLQDIFPNADENASWDMFIVKRVDSQVVLESLKVPFNFSDLTYNSGKLNLSSGTNTSSLKMNDDPVIRRTSPRQSAASAPNVYFTKEQTYTRVSSDEGDTAVWYGVRSPLDGNGTRWANTTYWTFAGDQVVLSFTPPPDTAPPVHVSHEFINARYVNGNDYWVQPGDQAYVRLRQRDPDSGNSNGYLRLYGSGQDNRANHNFTDTTTNYWQWGSETHVKITSADREENTSYGKVKWGVEAYTHGHRYDIHYFYRDIDGNSSPDYGDTGMNMRVDGVAPSHNSQGIYDHRYKNGNDYWVRPGDTLYAQLRQYDPDSGNKDQYIRLYGSGVDVRARHRFSDSSTSHMDNWVTHSSVIMNSASRQENTAYGMVRWTFTPQTHGDSYDVQYYYKDNVDNVPVDYTNTSYKVRVDGVDPSVSYDINSKSWTNSNITVNMNVSDSDSGVNRFRYRIYQNGSWGSYSSYVYGSSRTFTLSSEGLNRIHVQAEDNVGNLINVYSGNYYIDKTNPSLNSFGISGHAYKSGNDYWIKPNQSVDVRLRSYDNMALTYRQYIGLSGSSSARSQHDWNVSSTHLNNYNTSSYVTVNSVSETYESGDQRYREVTYNVTPNTHGHNYDVSYLFRDNATNWSNNNTWTQTGMTIRTDGVAPTHVSDQVLGARYVNGNDYWIRPNESVNVRLRQQDTDSGNKTQIIRFYGNGVDSKSGHSFGLASNDNNHWDTDPSLVINSATREENTSYGRVLWNVTAKTHGHSYDIHYYFRDNVDNNTGYNNTGKNLRVDGEAPYNSAETVSGERYNNGNDYWIKPGDTVDVHLRGVDDDSGLSAIYLSIGRDSNRNVYYHDLSGTSTNLNMLVSEPDYDVLSVNRDYVSGNVKGATFKVRGNTHGESQEIRRRYLDNVGIDTRLDAANYDAFGWSYTNTKYLRVDGVAPSVQYRNSSDTSNFTSRAWSTAAIDVRLKFSDADSGYKRSRYAWTQSTSLPSSWSSWSTSSNYVVSQSNYGAWYLHVQSEDNVGNLVSTYQGPFRFNNAPVASFSTDQSQYYVGDTMTVTSLASDPDGNALTYLYTITLPDGSTTTRTSPNFTYQFPDMPGNYSIRQDVTDIHGESDWVSTTIPVLDLSVVGHVKHTASWENRHIQNGNTPSQFYSGEVFVLEADVIDHPINRVEVDFSGLQNNGNLYTRNNLLLGVSSPTLYVGNLDEPAFAEGGTRLANGNVSFTFTAFYSNGIVRSDIVTVEIIGSVYDAFKFHKLH